MPLRTTTRRPQRHQRGNSSVFRRRLMFESLEDRRLLTILVTNTNDDGPGSLRQAIVDANTATVAEQIAFQIPASDPGFVDVDNGSGLFGSDADADVFRIALASNLPALNNSLGQPIRLDATTQTASTGDTNPHGPEIELDGSAFSNGHGLVLDSGNIEVRGLNIHSFSVLGVLVRGDDVTLGGNYIGTDATGRISMPNAVWGIQSFAARVTIGGPTAADTNIISANGGNGIEIGAGSSDVIVQNNLIGTDATGTVAIGNGLDGVEVYESSNVEIVDNVISGNDSYGIDIFRGTTNVSITGNFIGTNIDGSARLANGAAGVGIGDSSLITIGGLVPTEMNVISGNLGQGIFIGASDSVTLLGNHIGVNRVGDTAIGNGSPGRDSHGIRIEHGSTNITIGVPGAGNVISGNLSRGIGDTVVDRLTIQSNFIGTDATGTFAIPNQHDGIGFDGASNVLIGGDTPAHRNVIAGNARNGIDINHGTNIVIRGNVIGPDGTGTVALGNEVGVAVSDSGVSITDNLISGNNQSGVRINESGFSPTSLEWLVSDGGNGHFYVLTPARTWAVSEMLAATFGGHLADVVDLAENDFLTSNFGNASPWIGLTDQDLENTFVWSSGASYDPNSFTRFNGIEPNGSTSENYVQLLDTGFWNDLPGSRFHQAIWEFASMPDLGQIQAAFSSVTLTGNRIGTAVDGTEALANQGSGVQIDNASHTNVFNNLISGNTGSGILIENGINNVIGGVVSGAANTIANNGGIGVAVSGDSSRGNVIRGNSIFTNALLGIDLLGSTIDDLLDADTGPNGLQNKPVITGTSGSRVFGRLNSTPNSVFDIDIYATDTPPALDAEGQTWIGSVSATTDSAGDATFSLDASSLPTAFLTATATDAAGNTSEFSAAFESVAPTMTDLSVTITDNRSTVNRGDEVVYLAVVANNGPDTVTGATISTDIDLRLTRVSYVSNASGGATGNGSSLGQFLQETLTLPPGSSVTYQITGDVSSDASGTLSKRVSVAVPANAIDTNPLNNTDADTTLISDVISPQTFLVTNTNDSGGGSLREAILNANRSVGSASIQFAIPVTDPNFINIDSPADTGGDAEGDIFVIRPLTPLPSLSNSSFSITIDGGSQAAFLSETNPLGPEIVLDGSLLGGSGSTNSGLRVVSDANAISGLSIQNFRDAGLVISGDANSIFANYIGVDPTGRAARGNQVAGIVIAASASQNMIGGDQMSSGNLISGNAVGIEISGTQTQVQGNLIGTDITGTVAIPNLADGIVLKAGATHTTIGGVSALDGNFVLASDDRVTATVSSITLAEGTSEIRGSVFHDENANGVRDTDLVVGGEPDIVIVLDRSGSMSDPFGSVNGNARPISRLDAAIEGIIKLLDTLVQRGFGDEVEVSVVSFSDSGTPLDLDPTAPGTQDFTSLTADRDGNGVLDIIQALGKVAASGSTNYEAALRTATAVLRAHASLAGQSNVIFLSDGEPQSGSYGDEATTLRQMGTNLQAFGIGAEVPLDALQIIDANTQRIENTEQFVSVFTGADPSSVTFVEPGLANRLVYLDTNKNGRLDPSERSTVTDLTGEYTFAGLPPGTYSVVVDTRLGASNLISGNAGNGVTITQQGTAFNSVLGNLIGTDLHGESALANGGSGIAITAGASSNVIGGGTGATQNVISGNTAYGIILSGVGTISNIVQGNMIGTNIRGTNKLANETGGVSLTGGASSNTIGGTAVATRNVISGNNGSGVSLSGSNTLSNTIQGNHIGTDASGTMVVGSEDVAMETPSTTVASEDRIGIVISNGASHNIVEARNIISGNADGGISILGIESTGNLIRGNVIGTGVVRSQQIGNGGQGVVIQDASGNVIGGLDASDGNIIAFNHRNGVLIISGERNRILSNSIFGNYALGIDLGADGPTANDSRDEDTGPNQLQNKPEQLTAAVTSAGETVTVKAAFSLPTATTLTGPITIQFFLADLDGQEGSTLIGVDEVTAISPGARYESTLDPSSFTKINVQGNVLVATATDSQGNTSEFSDVAFIQPPPNTPQQLNDAAQAILNRASTSIQSTLDLEPPDIGSIDLPLPMKLESGDKTFLGIVDIELSESRAKTPDAMQRIHFQFLGSEAFTKSDLQTILANDNGSAEFEKQLFGGRVDLGENLVAFIWVDPPAWSVKTSTTSEPVFDSELRQSTPDGGAKFSTGAFRQDVLESIVTPFSDRETLSVSLTPPQGEPYRGGVNIYALVDGRYQLNYRTTFDSSGLVEHSQLDLLFRPSRAPRQLLVFAPHTSTSTTPEQDLSTKITAVDAPAPLTRFVSQEAIGSRYYDSVAGSQMDLEEQLLRTLEELLEGLKGIWEDLQQSVGGLSNLGVETMQRLKSGSSLQALSRRFLAISNGPDTAEATSAAYGIRRILLDAWSAIANQAIASEPRPAATEPPDAVESSQSVDGTDSMKQTAAALPTTETSTTTNASSGE